MFIKRYIIQITGTDKSIIPPGRLIIFSRSSSKRIEIDVDRRESRVIIIFRATSEMRRESVVIYPDMLVTFAIPAWGMIIKRQHITFEDTLPFNVPIL